MTEPDRRNCPEPLTLTYKDDRSFSLRNRGLLLWLLGLTAVTALVVICMPPAFWLCEIGAVLLAATSIFISARTGEWMTPREDQSPTLTWFEGWLGSTSIILMVVPLLGILLRE